MLIIFIQAEDGIRVLVRSRGLVDVYKRQDDHRVINGIANIVAGAGRCGRHANMQRNLDRCLLYTYDAADDLLCVDPGGRRIIQKNNHNQYLFLKCRHLHHYELINDLIVSHYHHIA